MKQSFRKNIASSLIALILFSTIGFNIIVSFCGGCQSEHIRVAYTVETSTRCECCAKNDLSQQCCNSASEHENEHHQTKSLLAQLKYDSTEAKSKIFKVVLPVVSFHSIALISNASATVLNVVTRVFDSLAPPLSVRSILTFICVFRN
jgi:hypothetical protein